MEITQQNNNEEGMALEKILKECMDAPGYMLFVGVITRRHDEKGFNLLDFLYRRYHFAYEDTKICFREFAKQLIREGVCEKDELIKMLKDQL